MAAQGVGVAIVDGIPLFRDALAHQVSRANGMRLLGVAGRLDAVADPRARQNLDVLVIDSVLDPDGSFVHFIADADPNIAILALVREPLYSARYVRTALAAGAHGLIPRAAHPRQLIEAIGGTFRERRYLHPALEQFTDGPVPVQGGTPSELTRRELEVLRLMADGLQSKSIGAALFISTETVRTHTKNICRKLSARDRAHAVANGFRTGLLVPTEDTQRKKPRPLMVPA
ncbi:response regulator transcription factor [Actinocrispum wychmicini]|uniref:DNA-binding NarL/FixJ family response regulator n=1 Tax=Actinocrispum wychmicini TaxID=1213861 RepID=A0A4R2IJK6_9PSEU|nr:response regulator transcription factor [Actinocrispum wychmicini]TCO44797.1 DNA-binding NarL/FixJ family response regulator [Actinocrispum wychmicini]